MGYRFKNFFASFLAMILVSSAALAIEINKYVPEGTDALIYFNIDVLRKAPLIQNNVNAKKVLFSKAGTIGATDTLDVLGLDLSKEAGISRVIVALKGSFSEECYILEGKMKLEPAILKKALSNKVSEGVYEITLPSKKVRYVSLLDSNTLLISPHKKFAEDAIEVKNGKKTTEVVKDLKGLLEKKTFDSTELVWFAKSGSSVDSTTAKALNIQKIMDKTQAFELSLRMDFDIKVSYRHWAYTQDGARDLKREIADWYDDFKPMLEGMKQELKKTTALNNQGKMLEAVFASIKYSGDVKGQVVDLLRLDMSKDLSEKVLEYFISDLMKDLKTR